MTKARSARRRNEETAQRRAAEAGDDELARMLRTYADDLASEGRSIAPMWMREAASRLEAMTRRRREAMEIVPVG